MFIKDMCSISPQKTSSDEFENGDFITYLDGKITAIEPNYTELIPRGQLRRMGKAIRMGIGASMPLIKRNQKMDGIIVGTGNGGLEDCIKFLDQIITYEEGVLTPTNFVQSTPNGLAGQLALGSQNHHYNTTHVNGSLAFESALVDAQLFFENDPSEEKQLLVSAVDEISSYNYNIERLNKCYKIEACSNADLIASKTEGTLPGEGATSFVISNSPLNALSEIVDTTQITLPTKNELSEVLQHFLQRNNLNLTDISMLLLGRNGDVRGDHWYDYFNSHFDNTPSLTFKQYCGENKTAIGFGVYFSTLLLTGKWNALKSKPKTILIYNQYEGIRHSIILMKSCTEKQT